MFDLALALILFQPQDTVVVTLPSLPDSQVSTVTSVCEARVLTLNTSWHVEIVPDVGRRISGYQITALINGRPVPGEAFGHFAAEMVNLEEPPVVFTRCGGGGLFEIVAYHGDNHTLWRENPNPD